MYNIDKDKQMEVLRWLMYAWDGQWLGRTTAVYGATEASKLNARVRAAFAKVEMKGLLALLGKKQADNLNDAAEMLKAYFQLVFGERGFQGKFSAVEAAPGGGARLQVQVGKMVALDSLKKVAQAANEPPAQICELLWTSWFEALLPDAKLQITSRSQNSSDIYQIDSLNEILTATSVDLFDVPMPEGLAAFATPATPETSETPRQNHRWTGNETVFGDKEPAPSRSNHQWTGNETVFGEDKRQPAVTPATPETSSPIADVLQIPLDQIKPTGSPNPYGGGRISFSPSAPTTANSGNNSLPQPPFGAPSAPTAGSNPLPQPPFGAAAPAASNPVNNPLPQPPFGAPLPPPPFGAAPQNNSMNTNNAALPQPPFGVPASPTSGSTPLPPPPFEMPPGKASPLRASGLVGGNEASLPPATDLPPLAAASGLGLTLDSSGRPLFSSNPEEEAKQKALKSKSKSLPGISRMFMSKEAKDTFAKTADEPVLQVTSVAMNVDVVLQNKLNQVRAANPGMFPQVIRVVGGSEGELNIVVGQHIFKSVDDIPPGPIQTIIRQAVAEWSESNF